MYINRARDCSQLQVLVWQRLRCDRWNKTCSKLLLGGKRLPGTGTPVEASSSCSQQQVSSEGEALRTKLTGRVLPLSEIRRPIIDLVHPCSSRWAISFILRHQEIESPRCVSARAGYVPPGASEHTAEFWGRISPCPPLRRKVHHLGNHHHPTYA
jgi:hypothetical protein